MLIVSRSLNICIITWSGNYTLISKRFAFHEDIDPRHLPKAYIIIPWIYSVEMDWALQISIQHITLPLHCNAVVIL